MNTLYNICFHNVYTIQILPLLGDRLLLLRPIFGFPQYWFILKHEPFDRPLQSSNALGVFHNRNPSNLDSDLDSLD